jgi:A/G-specific adenine glycosylase
VIPPARFRKNLLEWYAHAARDLPWRRTRDPYAIWVSEVMLQQTRVQAVIPYYERFLSRFPTIESLASAPEHEVLSLWAGLGYYSRARNLQAAAREIVADGAFPRTYHEIRSLPGIGDYTAAAIASIAFGLPHAAVDGNMARVLARMSGEEQDLKSPPVRRRLQALADDLLDRYAPGDFNQALMELGATVCLPREPQCLACPVAGLCEARAAGRQNDIPVRGRRDGRIRVSQTLIVIEKNGRVLLHQRDAKDRRLAGFWELPECVDGLTGDLVGRFRHSIVNHDYVFEIRTARLDRAPRGFRWWPLKRLGEIPLTTTARKAIECWNAAKVKK